MTTQSAVCSQCQTEHHTSDTTLIFMLMQPREAGPGSLRATRQESAVSDFSPELNSIYWKMFGGSKFSHSLTFSKKTFLQMRARIKSHPFSFVVPEAQIPLACSRGSPKRPKWLYEIKTNYNDYTNTVSPMLHIPYTF